MKAGEGCASLPVPAAARTAEPGHVCLHPCTPPVNAKVGPIAGAWSRLWDPFLTVLVAGQPLGLWPGSVVMVVVVALVVVPLSAGILWFLLSR